MKRIFALGTLGTLVGISFPLLRAQAPERPRRTVSAPAGNVEKGKIQFNARGCVHCHSYSGQGGTGARLAQNPITFRSFVDYVRKPKGAMPPYGNQVPEAELSDIYAYIKSIPPSPDPKTIPLLNQID